jgi:hypothetical protein
MTLEKVSVNSEPKDSGAVTWFVDEAGDPTLFGKGGKVVAATEGCSRFFIAGKLECRDVDALTADLERLRKDVVADPFFKDVPSLDPARKRTAVHFHAKDDPPEVRFMVYKLLALHDLRFVAVVRDKLRLVDYALQRRRIDPAYRYDPTGHELYDELTRHLFSRLHGWSDHKIVFRAAWAQTPHQGICGRHRPRGRRRLRGTLACQSPSQRRCCVRCPRTMRAAGGRLLPVGVAALLRAGRGQIPEFCVAADAGGLGLGCGGDP